MGYQQEVCGKTKFDFVKLGAGNSQEIVIGKALDATSTTKCVLEVRLHDRDISAAGGTIEVIVRAESPSADEPNREFVNPDPLATVTIDSTTPATSVEIPTLMLDELTSVYGGALRVVVKGTQANPVIADLNATISVALSHKA